MKSQVRAWLFVLVALFLTVPFFCYADVSSIDNGYAEKINSYSVDIKINHDRSLEIIEEIVYDFGNNQKHGIQRYIPTYYEGRLGSPYTPISDIKITDQKSKRIPFETQKDSKIIKFRIGDANRLVSGLQTYRISYLVKNAASLYDDREEIYWDAVGNDWKIPIKNITVNLTSENNILSKSNFSCFRGDYGSTEECKTIEKDDQKIVFTATNAPYQAVTVFSKFEKGTFKRLSGWEKLVWGTPWYLIFPLGFLVIYIWLWAKYGRDPAKSGAIVVQYSPQKGMTPMLAGIVSNPLKAAIVYLSAEIITLAIGGYLKIKQIEKSGILKFGNDYELLKLKEADDKLADYQKKILNTFFEGRSSVKLSDLKTDTDFGQEIRTVPGLARSLAKEKGYFKFSPILTLILSLILTGLLITFSAVIFGFFMANGFSWTILIATWIIMIILSFLMPKRTSEGLKAAEYLSGLQIYINYAEKDRIKFLNEPKKSPEKFEELLPYAIVFRLEKEWAKQFEGIYKQPDWYQGNFVTGFTVGSLAHDLGGFNSVATSSTSVSTSSGGGGFSGGGGGGGGGGSW